MEIHSREPIEKCRHSGGSLSKETLQVGKSHEDTKARENSFSSLGPFVTKNGFSAEGLKLFPGEALREHFVDFVLNNFNPF